MVPLRQFANHPDPMDLWLESQGYYRKLTARDGSSLFRAIAEQIFCTQRYHSEVRKQCVDYLTEHQELFQAFDLEESIEEYVEHLQNPTQWGGPIEVATCSILYKVSILVFKEVGVHPRCEQQEETAKTIMLCYSQDHHYDSVYLKDYTKVAGFCQSLVYEILYKDVFMMKDVSYAVEKMLHYKPLRHRNDLGMCSSRKLLNFNCSSVQFERRGIEEVLDGEVNVRDLLNKGITPFPYKVAKSLDPNILRNVEFDVWVDYRRGLRFGYFDSSGELRVGVKCLVKLNDGGGYVGHIQEMAPDKGPVVLFVEEFGEKQTVPYECLEVLPQEPPSTKQWPFSFQAHRSSTSSTSKHSSSSAEQGNKSRKGREGGESKSSKNAQPRVTRSGNRKTSLCNSSCDGSAGNNVTPQQGANLVTYGAVSSPEAYIPYPNYQVEADVSMPVSLQYPTLTQTPMSPLSPRHSPLLLPLSPSSDDMPYRYAPFTFTPDPKDNARLASTSPSGPICPTDYFQFVPYDSSTVGCDISEQNGGPLKNSNYMANDVWKTQGQINFNAPKSLLDNGADLPMSDIQTLRFFYNLGNDVYRAQCYSWNGPGVCSSVSCAPSCSVANGTSSYSGKVGNSVSSDCALLSPDASSTACGGGPRRKRRETTVSSPGGVSMSSESETGDFAPRVANAAPSPNSSQSSHLPPRFKKESKSGGKSKETDTKREETSSSTAAQAQSLTSKRTGDSASRLEPLILNDISKDSTEHVLPVTLPYGYVCYPNVPFSPVDSDPNMPFLPSCRFDYMADSRQQCYSPVSDVGSPYPVYAPSSHFIFPASPGIYVGTPTWAAMTPPTPQ